MARDGSTQIPTVCFTPGDIYVIGNQVTIHIDSGVQLALWCQDTSQEVATVDI